MAVKIRLQRMGTKKKPFYRIIAVDEREKRDGKFIDQLGRYQPIVDGEQLVGTAPFPSQWNNFVSSTTSCSPSTIGW